MFKINDNFCKLSQNYLFSEVARRISEFQQSHPEADIIRMGIGDVTRPLCPAAINALQQAVSEQATSEGFKGYGPEQGYPTLREKIARNDYQERGINISPDEIFISDGAKSDTGNIGDILSVKNKVAVTDPVYPVYIDTNVMAGRAGVQTDEGLWSDIEYISCTDANNFIPALPSKHTDVIYLCYPNNPTGTTLTRDQLARWVDYARQNGCLILFDSAYEAFITEDDVPHSIYEIPGAKEVAIEFRSFSKTAGFTGLRCAYTVVPKELMGEDENGNKVSLNHLWNRRQCTKFNGASYLSQRAAEALYSDEGKKQVRETINYYLRNAGLLRDAMKQLGYETFGGVNSPYIWIKAPDGLSSWEFFTILLEKCNVACTPGVGFGPSGEGYIRLTGFASHENTLRAVERFKILKK